MTGFDPDWKPEPAFAVWFLEQLHEAGVAIRHGNPQGTAVATARSLLNQAPGDVAEDLTMGMFVAVSAFKMLAAGMLPMNVSAQQAEADIVKRLNDARAISTRERKRREPE